MPGLEFNDETAVDTSENPRHSAIRHTIEHAAHLLPSQGPITVFVHHNTLHAFEHLDFDAGVQAGGRMLGCHAYLPEDRYREKLQRGRIRIDDLEAVLQEDLGDEADRLVSIFCTRYALRLSMLQFPLHTGSTHELRWVVAETDALRRFRDEVPAKVREEMLSDTRKAVLDRTTAAQGASEDPSPAHRASIRTLDIVLDQFDTTSLGSWNDRTWEAFVLNYLWRTCCEGVRKAVTEAGRAGEEHVSDRVDDPSISTAPKGAFKRHRDVLLKSGADDADLPVHETLVRFCSAFLDQGFADWNLPNRKLGFYRSFLQLYGGGFVPSRWLRAVRRECRRLLGADMEPIESIEESLALLGVAEAEQEAFIRQTLLALRGWAGMLWQMETNAEWSPSPAPSGSLIEYLAIRLMLDRLALQTAASDLCGFTRPLSELRDTFGHDEQTVDRNDFDLRAFTVFQLAQVLGWRPRDLENLAPQQWAVLVHEIDAFPALQRRRIYHRAFERKYRNETLDAVIAHNSPQNINPLSISQQCEQGLLNSPARADDSPTGAIGCSQPLFQIACCIDEREESFRRHLEEIQPDCETFGIAGFFGVAMYYRGLSDAHFTPLCPVNVKPDHYVVENAAYSAMEVERRRADARRRLGHATHQGASGNTLFRRGGVLTGLFGSIAAIPLVARVFFPRATARIQELVGRIVHTGSTELQLERIERGPGQDERPHRAIASQRWRPLLKVVCVPWGLLKPTYFRA